MRVSGGWRAGKSLELCLWVNGFLGFDGVIGAVLFVHTFESLERLNWPFLPALGGARHDSPATDRAVVVGIAVAVGVVGGGGCRGGWATRGGRRVVGGAGIATARAGVAVGSETVGVSGRTRCEGSVQSGVAEKDPNATPVSFLREELVVDHHEAKADLRAAESCERFPELAQACRDGRVDRDKMDLILRVGLRNRQRERALPRFMNIFIDLAASAPTSQLRKALELWADQIDPRHSGP